MMGIMRPVCVVAPRGRHGPAVVLLLAVTVIVVISTPVFGQTPAPTTPSCRMVDGQMPPDGSCAGPMERTLLRRVNFNVTQTGCPLSLVRYWVDGAQNRPPRCGECVPGTAGVDDPMKLCGINDYCNDAGGPSALGWCGPGLRCIAHACLPCAEGVYDPTDGKMCVLGKWTYSKWAMVFYDPAALTMLFLAFCVLLLLLVRLGVAIHRWVLRRNDEKAIEGEIDELLPPTAVSLRRTGRRGSGDEGNDDDGSDAEQSDYSEQQDDEDGDGEDDDDRTEASEGDADAAADRGRARLYRAEEYGGPRGSRVPAPAPAPAAAAATPRRRF